MDIGQANLFSKDGKRSDVVRQVMDNVKEEMLINTYRNVKARLSEFRPFGYSSAGVVM
ncbi:MAG TPA: hypothetical protein P5239_07730 [Victivallales bacterium]|nr:hypothetical protein [Victivallales bacterium]